MGSPATLGYTPGSGANVATQQDDAGAHHQKAVNEFVDEAGSPSPVTPSSPMPVQEQSSPGSLLQRILSVLLSPVGYDRTIGRQRSTAVIESGTVTTVTTVTTVSTITALQALNNIDGRNGSMLINAANLSAWADVHRSRIS
ncbi:MAG: hypothetical protein IOD11_20535 [Rhodocyclaceae bacterium]|nr:hypothetical protein [Rhodocyclaceae bacterium]MCA3097477.1 hypothetical protein [Rhodocyclaceae bacterium]MCA3120568.1 hypothetical protein [Rhodocyclaceae bacterium]